MSGQASRDKGANAERAVKDYLRSLGYMHARRVLAGDGHQHTDIECFKGISIEVKDRKVSRWPTWREQAVKQALPGDLVVVIRKLKGTRNVGKWPTQMPQSDWFLLGGLPIATFPCPRLNEQWIATTFNDVMLLISAKEKGTSGYYGRN